MTAFLKKCATCTRVYLYRVYDVKNTAAADHSHRATKLAVPFRSGRRLVGSAGHVDGVVVSIVGAHLQKFKESTLIDFARCAGTSVPHTSGFVQTRQEAADEHPGRRSCHTAASAKKKTTRRGKCWTPRRSQIHSTLACKTSTDHSGRGSASQTRCSERQCAPVTQWAPILAGAYPMLHDISHLFSRAPFPLREHVHRIAIPSAYSF